MTVAARALEQRLERVEERMERLCPEEVSQLEEQIIAALGRPALRAIKAQAFVSPEQKRTARWLDLLIAELKKEPVG